MTDTGKIAAHRHPVLLWPEKAMVGEKEKQNKIQDLK